MLAPCFQYVVCGLALKQQCGVKWTTLPLILIMTENIIIWVMILSWFSGCAINSTKTESFVKNTGQTTTQIYFVCTEMHVSRQTHTHTHTHMYTHTMYACTHAYMHANMQNHTIHTSSLSKDTGHKCAPSVIPFRIHSVSESEVLLHWQSNAPKYLTSSSRIHLAYSWHLTLERFSIKEC